MGRRKTEAARRRRRRRAARRSRRAPPGASRRNRRPARRPCSASRTRPWTGSRMKTRSRTWARSTRGHRRTAPRRPARRCRIGTSDRNGDPLDGIVNLFYVAIVLAVGFLVAALSAAGVAGLLTNDNMTIVTNPGTPQMQVIVKEGDKITKLDMQSGTEVQGIGTLLGSFYKLADGTVIYVPAGSSPPTGSTPLPGATPTSTPTPGVTATPTPGVTPYPTTDPYATPTPLPYPTNPYATPTPGVTLTPAAGPTERH